MKQPPESFHQWGHSYKLVKHIAGNVYLYMRGRGRNPKKFQYVALNAANLEPYTWEAECGSYRFSPTTNKWRITLRNRRADYDYMSGWHGGNENLEKFCRLVEIFSC